MAESMERSRHIPADVRAAVIEESRGRCCLCRQPTIPGSSRRELLSDVLEKHHILHFSKGGEHSIENLVVVCPDCHRLFHKFPEEYPAERLSKAKQRWAAIASVVDRELLYTGRAPILSEGEALRLLRVPFRLESYGLSFETVVPDSISVEMYLEFLGEYILKPIGQFDGDKYLTNLEQVKLSHKLDTNETFREASRLSDIALEPDDAYVVHVHVPAVYAPGTDKRILLRVHPEKPKVHEGYRVEFRVEPPLSPISFSLEVTGTDGYHSVREVESSAKCAPITVPGASRGVRDIIEARGDFESLRLEVVFGDLSDFEEEGS